MTLNRKSGILLHISSLPSACGVGDFGAEAYSFIDQLVGNGFSLWQILPFGPNGPGNSPYQAYSAFAGDMLFISIEEIKKWGLLSNENIENIPLFNKKKVEFSKVFKWKYKLLQIAWRNFHSSADTDFQNEFNAFKKEHDWWLEDYSLYIVCKLKFNGQPWNKWPEGIAFRDYKEILKLKQEMASDIEYEKFVQFLFYRQWFQLKKYANDKKIEIFGDLPLYVAHDSSDVWANQDLFQLNEIGEAECVGGVPPDYFSEDGQLWGNPVFNWAKLAETNYQWWVARLYFNLHLFNLVRIDHFRGLESYWSIPADSVTAKNGDWKLANGMELLKILNSQIGELPIIAEDLGIITPEGEELRDKFQLPGMKVLQFAFTSGYKNVHLPHNYHGRNFAYTGTHDNDTLIGWWRSLSREEKIKIKIYLNFKNGTISKQLIEMVWSSSAEVAIIPMQDVLELGGEARMNTPGTPEGNWGWRYNKKQLKKEHFQFMNNLNKIYNRYHGEDI